MSESSSHPARRVAILGAGPIGLEAALAFAEAGFDVEVYERGEVAASLQRWGHITLFSPWSLNTSPRGLAALQAQGGALPDPDAFPTGHAYRDTYLAALASSPRLAGRVHTHTRVLGVGRQGVLKGELIGSASRRERPFRLLLEDAQGTQRIAHADLVLDATGTYEQPNPLGDAGLRAPGEDAAARAGRVVYGNPDVLGAARERFVGQHVALIGDGYSAATSLRALLTLVEQDAATRVTWITRSSEAPYARIPQDVLPQRDLLAALGNAIAAGDHPHGERVTRRPGAAVEAIQLEEGGALTLLLRGEDGAVSEVGGVHRVLACTGFRPDPGLYRELQVHQCYASEGPMKLAAALLAAGGGGGDCLAQTSAGPETLKSPEPDLFILGAKSYGRRSDFLLKLGLQQIEELLTLVAP